MTMALLTCFKTTSTCPHCGREGKTEILSHLGSHGAEYKIGDCPGRDIPPVDFDDTSYLVRTPSPVEETRVLLSWTCLFCKLETFAEVSFADGCIRDIQSVELNPETLARLNYIGEDVQDMIEMIIGASVYDDAGVRPDLIEKLRSSLEAGRRWGQP